MRNIITGQPWQAGREYLLQGITWVDGVPYLDVVDVRSEQVELYPVIGQHIGIRVQQEARFCLGRYSFVDGTGIEHLRCPKLLQAEANGQCAECAAQDEFRFAHHFHTGGFAPESLVRYMSQPHWIYVATFADASSKVGTAADVRKRSRLDEQGAVAATYVGRAANGRIARFAEDQVTAQLSLRQSKRRSAKIIALANPASSQSVERQHAEAVRQVALLLRNMAPSSEVEVPMEPWAPPPAYEPFIDTRPRTDWVPYPHSLQAGEHGFCVTGCAGPAVLAGSAEQTCGPWYVIDLGGMKGLRVTAGDYVSPAALVQTALF